VSVSSIRGPWAHRPWDRRLLFVVGPYACTSVPGSIHPHITTHMLLSYIGAPALHTPARTAHFRHSSHEVCGPHAG
jgi:hypothetical protein